MGGVNFVVHLFSLLGFFLLVFIGITLKKRSNLLKSLVLSGSERSKSKILVDWPLRLVREICNCLDIEFESSVHHKRCSPAKIQLAVLSSFIRRYSVYKVFCEIFDDSGRVRMTFLTDQDVNTDIENDLSTALGGEVEVVITRRVSS